MIATDRRFRARKCVRCYQGPRHVNDDGTAAYLCAECIVAGDYRAEMEEAKAADPEHPQLWLMQHRSWFGGWTIGRRP